MYPFIYFTDTLAQAANLGVGKYPLRFTFRFVNNTENFDPETLYIFYGKHTAFKLDTLNPADEIGDEIMDPVVNIVI